MKKLAFILLFVLVSAAFAEPLSYDDPTLWAWQGEGDHPIDLFLICPTVDIGEDGNANMDVTDEKLREHFMSALMQEKGLYDQTCTLYAPYYRQATFPAYEGADNAEAAFDFAYADIRAAFEHYLTLSDRPFILAGFSQGGQMSLRLLQDLFEDPAVNDRLVAAYLIGWRVTEEDLRPWMRMAQAEDDTGCIICFEAESPETEDSIIVPKGVHSLAINPLNWQTDGTVADRRLNRGACFTDHHGDITKEIPELTGAYIDATRGTLKVPDVSPKDYPGEIFPDGCYHLYDFFFFFRNLQNNVSARAEAYLGSLDIALNDAA